MGGHRGRRADHGHRGHPRRAADPVRRAPAQAAHPAGRRQGQAHFAYLPPSHQTLQSGPDLDYRRARRRRRAPSSSPAATSWRTTRPSPGWPPASSRVGGRDDLPDPGLYERQTPHRRPARHPGRGQAGVVAGGGVPVPGDARRGEAERDGPLPRRRLLRRGAVAHRRRVLGLQPVQPGVGGGRACGSPGRSATPRCRSTSGAAAARAACSTCSTRPRWPTATTWSRSSPARTGCGAARWGWSACRTPASPSCSPPPPTRPTWPP